MGHSQRLDGLPTREWEERDPSLHRPDPADMAPGVGASPGSAVILQLYLENLDAVSATLSSPARSCSVENGGILPVDFADSSEGV